MKGIILLGGYGTRLRPLTISIPKPLVEFANKPLVLHQIEALIEAGCTEVVLAITYPRQALESFVREWEEKIGIQIVLSEDRNPLGTAGPLALARDHLRSDGGEPFYLINGDTVCRFPLQKLLHFHQSCQAEVTLLVKDVPDPERFGAVVTDKSGKVECFVEKPSSFLSARINAGVYVMNSSVLDRIQTKPTSLEKEILPAVAACGSLYALPLDGYWTDLGQPDDYLNGLGMYLADAHIYSSSSLTGGEMFEGNVLLGKDVTIGKDGRIGPNVSIGDGCTIGIGVRLQNCAIMAGSVIQDYVYCMDSILGAKCSVGKWCRLENACTFGEDVTCKDELMFNGATVLPHKTLTESVMHPSIIL